MLSRNRIGCPELLGAGHNGRGKDVAAWNGCWLGSALTKRLDVNHRGTSELGGAGWGGVGFPGSKTRGRVTIDNEEVGPYLLLLSFVEGTTPALVSTHDVDSSVLCR
jgi:hypothetical protein